MGLFNFLTRKKEDELLKLGNVLILCKRPDMVFKHFFRPFKVQIIMESKATVVIKNLDDVSEEPRRYAKYDFWHYYALVEWVEKAPRVVEIQDNKPLELPPHIHQRDITTSGIQPYKRRFAKRNLN